jgi:hypothetical protein
MRFTDLIFLEPASISFLEAILGANSANFKVGRLAKE